MYRVSLSPERISLVLIFSLVIGYVKEFALIRNSAVIKVYLPFIHF